MPVSRSQSFKQLCLSVCPGGEVSVRQHSGAQQRQMALSSEREEVQGKLSYLCVCVSSLGERLPW